MAIPGRYLTALVTSAMQLIGNPRSKPYEATGIGWAYRPTKHNSETWRNSGWVVDGSRIQRNVVEDLEANPKKIEFTPGFCLLFLVTIQLFMSLESIVWSVFNSVLPSDCDRTSVSKTDYQVTTPNWMICVSTSTGQNIPKQDFGP